MGVLARAVPHPAAAAAAVMVPILPAVPPVVSRLDLAGAGAAPAVAVPIPEVVVVPSHAGSPNGPASVPPPSQADSSIVTSVQDAPSLRSNLSASLADLALSRRGPQPTTTVAS
jgi:hypothetical protein